MPTYQLVDGVEIWDATGLSNPVFDFVDDGSGNRKRSATQSVCETTNLPLWSIGVTRPVEVWGRMEERQSEVIVPSAEVPVLKRHRPIKFSGLTVTPSARLINGKAVLMEKFAATKFVQPGTTAAQTGTNN